MPGRAVFRELPKYEIVGGVMQEIRYAVRETVSAQGYDVIYPDPVLSYAAYGADTVLTIQNRAVAISVSVSKVWDKGLIPDGASATFRLYSYTGSDPSAARWVSNVNDITLDGTADGGIFGETAAPWRADFTGLPKYDSSGTELHYIVREVSCTPAGYEPVEGYAVTGGAITNRPAATSFTVSKRWSGTAGNAWPYGEEIKLLRGLYK